MQENIRQTIVRNDEAISTANIKPLHQAINADDVHTRFCLRLSLVRCNSSAFVISPPSYLPTLCSDNCPAPLNYFVQIINHLYSAFDVRWKTCCDALQHTDNEC